MNSSTTDRIQREITLSAPRSRVWRALSDSKEFSEWFGIEFDGPFRVGEKLIGKATLPSCGVVSFDLWIERMDAEQVFAYRWHPHAVDPAVDYSKEPTTLVEFHLEDDGDGTRLTVTESGFDRIPKERRDEAFRMNDGGWTGQMERITSYIDG